jgi:hypothetical protein
MRDLLDLLNNKKPADELVLDPDNIDTDNLVPNRLKGPGARTAKLKVEPKTDAVTLGRERRK